MILLHNAQILTLDPANPTASVLVLEGGRILAVGDDRLLGEYGWSRCEDMGKGFILPGLTDAHLHLQEMALFASIIDCETDTKNECLSRVAERAKQTKPGEWILGHGWNQNDWGGDWPTAAELELAAPGRPVYLTAKSLHASWASLTAMRLAGIDPSTPEPLHGSIQHDPTGMPTGILLETAMKLVEKIIPEESAEAIARMLKEKIIPALWRMGLTGVHDFDKRTCLQALQILDEREDLRLRVVKSIPLDLLSQAAALGLRSGFGSDNLRIGSVKLFADGALGPRTAAMFEAYIDDGENRGMLILDEDTLFEYGCLAAGNGLSLAVHAIGDRAVHEMLNGFERLRHYEHKKGLPALRHRIEHVQTIHPNDAGRLAELGVIASMQPGHAPSDMEMAERHLGNRSAYCYAWRTQLDHHAHLIFGSDAPVESPNPFLGIHAAVTRRRLDGAPGSDGWHPEQRLTLREALEGYTLGPAYAAGMESHLGRFKPGALADLIVLDVDPFSCSMDELVSIKPVATMVGGEWVWQM